MPTETKKDELTDCLLGAPVENQRTGMNSFTNQEIEGLISLAFTNGTLSPGADFRQSQATSLFFSLCEQRNITNEDLSYGFIKYPRITFSTRQADTIYELIEQAFLNGQAAEGIFRHTPNAPPPNYKDSTAFYEFIKSATKRKVQA